MKRIHAALAILCAMTLFSACAPAVPTIIPVETLFAGTVAVLKLSETPTRIVTNTSEPTPAEATHTPIPDAEGSQCIPNNTESVRARVVRVIDGDTIEVAISNEVYKVRYIGMDTPEATTQIDYYGPQATGENKRLVDGQVVELIKDVSETDQYGRLLRYVLVEGVFVNYHLVKNGFASAVTFPPDIACQQVFQRAEASARQAVLGLWAPTPVPSDTPAPTASPTSLFPPTNTPSLKKVCSCSETWTCKDFRNQKDAAACFTYCKAIGQDESVAGLDKNNNGQVCEGSN